MSRILYLDCFSGISGDMLLGALIDAGLPIDDLRRALGSLAVSGYDVDARRVLRAGVSAVKFDVHEHEAGSAHAASGAPHAASGAPHAAPGASHPEPRTPHGHDHDHHDHHHHDHDHGHEHPHRSLPEIFQLIDGSALSPAGRDRARELFQRLAEAEASIHQMPVDQVHLHEVGALDSIIDIVGAVFGLEWFGAVRIVCSPLNVGGGMVRSAHGLFPVPAPATVKLLADAPVYGGTVQQELVTPTGALIVSSYATSFGPIPRMSIEKVGYGAGQRDFPSTPNVLRVLVGRADDRPSVDRVVVIECEIDDMNPQIFGAAMEQLYEAGAVEVFYVPVQMKKNRPGTLLTVVAPPELRAALTDIIFRETTTIGLRHSEVDRECLQREMVAVETPLGVVGFKVAWRDGRVINAAPEFEDCVKLASTHRLSIKDVQVIAVKAFNGYQSRQS
jgi:pyridinium-3,5-bisthiocarboxylic acid mononucleotide nickel chelatase